MSSILPQSPLTADIPNAPYPTAGQGLVLDVNGRLPPGVLSAIYRKTTSKAVNTTVSATDLFNGEITIAAGAMGTTGAARVAIIGDWLQNSGGPVVPPRFQVVFGGTTLLDTGTSGTTANTNALRAGWSMDILIANLGAANSQASRLNLYLHVPGGFTAFAASNITTGEGIYYSSNALAPGGFSGLAHGTNPSTAVDTSVAKTLVLNVINGSASASYETRLLSALVEII